MPASFGISIQCYQVPFSTTKEDNRSSSSKLQVFRRHWESSIKAIAKRTSTEPFQVRRMCTRSSGPAVHRSPAKTDWTVAPLAAHGRLIRTPKRFLHTDHTPFKFQSPGRRIFDELLCDRVSYPLANFAFINVNSCHPAHTACAGAKNIGRKA